METAHSDRQVEAGRRIFVKVLDTLDSFIGLLGVNGTVIEMNTAALAAMSLDRRDLRFRRINTTSAAVNGKPVEAYIGQSVVEILPDSAISMLRRVLTSGEFLRTSRFRGSRRNLRASPHSGRSISIRSRTTWGRCEGSASLCVM